MADSMRPALVIGLICFAGLAIGSLRVDYAIGGLINGAYIFCLSSMGLAFAKKIPGFEPLPVCAGFLKKEGRARQLLLMLLFSAAIAALLLFIGSLLFSGCLLLFHEPDKSAQAITSLPTKNKLLAFPLLLAGAGIAEECMFRLFF
jgi:hypothetical protein